MEAEAATEVQMFALRQCVERAGSHEAAHVELRYLSTLARVASVRALLEGAAERHLAALDAGATKCAAAAGALGASAPAMAAVFVEARGRAAREGRAAAARAATQTDAEETLAALNERHAALAAEASRLRAALRAAAPAPTPTTLMPVLEAEGALEGEAEADPGAPALSDRAIPSHDQAAQAERDDCAHATPPRRSGYALLRSDSADELGRDGSASPPLLTLEPPVNGAFEDVATVAREAAAAVAAARGGPARSKSQLIAALDAAADEAAAAAAAGGGAGYALVRGPRRARRSLMDALNDSPYSRSDSSSAKPPQGPYTPAGTCGHKKCKAAAAEGEANGTAASPALAPARRAAAGPGGSPGPLITLQDFTYVDELDAITLTVQLGPALEAAAGFATAAAAAVPSSPFASPARGGAACGPTARAMLVDFSDDTFRLRVCSPADPLRPVAIFGLPELHAPIDAARSRVVLQGERLVARLAKRAPAPWPSPRRVRGEGGLLPDGKQMGFAPGTLPTNEQLRGLDTWRVA